MVMVNLASPQGGWFFNQNSLGALDVLSFGVGYDQMSRSGAGFDDHEAWSVFFTAEKSLGGGHLSANAAYYDWEGVGRYRTRFGSTTAARPRSPRLAFLPAAASGSRWSAGRTRTRMTAAKLDTIGIGLGYYISGHRANIKAEYSIDDQFIGTGEEVDAFRMQAQLFF
jgi:hypothetical protein